MIQAIGSFVPGLVKLFRRARLRLYLLFTLPCRDFEPRTAFFRFGIPLVLKKTCRTVSTEADALRYLNQVTPQLPIPKLIDSVELDGAVYTLMTRLPGRRFLDRSPDITPEGCAVITQEITAILHQLWAIPQPADIRGKVMMSASGDGLPYPPALREALAGPFESTLDCYGHMIFTKLEDLPDYVPRALRNDPIVWVHTDLMMQNILIDDEGHVTGVVDWEDSGWLPKHWQLHTLRRPRFGCMGAWVRFWCSQYRCDTVTESAYDASLADGVLVYPL